MDEFSRTRTQTSSSGGAGYVVAAIIVLLVLLYALFGGGQGPSEAPAVIDGTQTAPVVDETAPAQPVAPAPDQ